MIITRNWLQEWVDISQISSERILSTLNSIGLEVDSYKEGIKIPPKVVVGYVQSKRKHDDSDHLSICEVNVGNEILQIVCGAKNVEIGQYVCVSLIGAQLSGGLKIKPAKLRGVESRGMICSCTELGLAKINDGIMVLDNSIGELILGKELCEYEQLSDDIIEIDLTPNRGDCLSVYGVARDLSAALDIPLKENRPYEENDGLLGIGRIISVHADEKVDASFAYRAFDIKDKFELDLVKKMRLAIAGILKSNSVENILSYVTHSTGVLLRAYDYHKICSSCDKISLDIIEEKDGQFGVYYGKDRLSYAGILQNEKAKIDDNTKTVIVEASYTAPEIISRAVGENKNLKGDEHVYRSSRGSEPNLTIGQDLVFRILSKIKPISIYAGTQQITSHKERSLISVSSGEISNMIGYSIARNDIVKILKKLEFDVSLEKELINIRVPAFRHDILNSHDICEEIVRIIGIDNIPSKPLLFSEQNRLNDSFCRYENYKYLRYKAVGTGFFECVHYVFDNGKELENLGFVPCKIEILNPINNELNSLRPTLINHLLNSAQRNIKNSKKSVKLFELGTVFDINGKESARLGFIASGLKNESSILNGAKPQNIDFFYFAQMIQNVIGKFECRVLENKISYLSEFEQGEIVQNSKVVGYMGRVDICVESQYDLLKTYLCEIDLDLLAFERIEAKDYSKFPSINRDLSLLVPSYMRYEEIKKCIDSLNISILKEHIPVDIYKDESLGDLSSVTVKFIFQDMNKTLEDEDIDAYMDIILQTLSKNLGLSLR